MRRRRLLVLAWVTVALVTGCAAGSTVEAELTPPPQSSAAPSTTPVATPGESEAIELVGLWRVSGAAGESDQTWLRLDAGRFDLWRECGIISGSWIAGERAFIAAVNGGSAECVGGALPDIPWLDSVTAYEPTDAGWRLTDETGAVMASLAIDGRPNRSTPQTSSSLKHP